MKKILILIVVLALGSGFWFGRHYFKNLIRKPNAASDIVFATTTPAKENPLPAKPVAVVPSQSPSLQSLAVQLLNRDPIISGQLSDDLKTRTQDDIKTLKTDLRDTYLDAQAWIKLANDYKFLGDYAGAKDLLNFVIKIQPTNYLAFHNLGDLYGFYLKDSAAAEADFLKSIEYNPQNLDAYQELISLYNAGYRGVQPIDALLLKGMAESPNNPGLPLLLAEYYENQQDLTNALKYYQQALSLAPQSPVLQSEVQRIKSELGVN